MDQKSKVGKITKKASNITKNIKKIKATAVRQNFQEVVDNVHYTKEAIIISKYGKPWVFIQPLDEGQNLQELVE
ncbi:MAG: type II toxin-antitoxin system prevent-host-death family antitoxin [Candidatus Moranbacteria bacterium]|nr:type II toxin-antitoxin system prevent-host-death family antitoxin [Candidatus Moranbacteria bacterium]